MHYLVGAIVIAIVALVIIVSGILTSGRSAWAGENPPVQPPAVAGQEKSGAPKLASRAELEKRLGELAKSEPPKDLAPGAECYKTAGPPRREDYTCPTCGERTLYAAMGQAAKKGETDKTDKAEK